MIRQKIVNILFFLLIVTTSAFSQSRTTIIENVNATKAGLVHVLNRTGDTIILKSSTPIFRFSFLFHSQKESVLMDLGSKEAKIPLHHFEVGRYTVVAYREDAVYPISLDRIEVISKPTDAIVDLEEDVLRASLSEEEQRKRNIKPRVNSDRDTRLANVATKSNRVVDEVKERDQRASVKKDAEDKARKEAALAEVKEEERRAFIKREAEDKARKEIALAEVKEEERRAFIKREAEDKARKEIALAEVKEEERRTFIKREAEDKAREEIALAEVKEKELRALIKREAEDKSKKEHALAEANRDRLEQERADKEQAQIEANRKAIKEREIAEAKRKEDRAIALAEAERKKENRTVAENKVEKPSKQIEVKEVKYNISDINNHALDKQTREEYRKENLRPNGKKYDE